MDPVKVFIVDDSAQLIEVLSELISDPGNVVVCGSADTAQQAVEDIAQTVADVVIADLQLTDGSGFDVVKAIREQESASGHGTGSKRTLVMLFSNHVSPELKRHALALGADHFLDKSSDHVRLIELIQQRVAAR